MLQVLPSEIFRPIPFLLVSPSSTSTQARTFRVHEAGGRAYEGLPLPIFYRLSSLPDAKYEPLRPPLNLTIEDAGLNGFLAVNGERVIDVYGVGESPEDAVRNFAVALIELYNDLSAREDLLSAELREELAYLQGLIRHRSKRNANGEAEPQTRPEL